LQTGHPVADTFDPEYQKFLQKLAKSGSDKSFYIQRKYKHLMPVTDGRHVRDARGVYSDLVFPIDSTILHWYSVQ
jgi:hypothetical protein